MDDLIIVLIVVCIVVLAGGYVWKARKKGVKCIGCPDSGKCSGSCAGCTGCGCKKKAD